MGPTPSASDVEVVLDRPGLAGLVRALVDDGYRVLAPVVRDGAIVPAPVTDLDQFAAGWTEDQEAGRYRLRRRDDDALFGHAVGPDGPRRTFFEPRVELLRSTREGGDGTPVELTFSRGHGDDDPPVAMVGVKGCELAAIGIQDRVLAGGAHPDPHYVRRRRDALLVSVDCGDPAPTCFCPSMGTGPVADGAGAHGVVPDVRLTELLDGGRHEFLARAGTDRGGDLLLRVGGRDVTGADRDAATAVTDAAVAWIAAEGRQLDAAGAAERLAVRMDHPRWDEVAERCLSCTNCTMVCPTCFCSSVEDVTDLSGDEALRLRRWDSCFTLEHSYVHGGSIHSSVRSRYRQWLTHKLSTWHDQFGTSGCVGCGRCITWCPVGIDLVEEAAAIMEGPAHG